MWQFISAHGSHLFPRRGDASVIDGVESISKSLAHDDCAVNGQFEIHDSDANCCDHGLHSVKLLKWARSQQKLVLSSKPSKSMYP